jgi:uncharacterized protein HemY
MDDLMKAKEAQKVVLRRVVQEQPDAQQRESGVMAQLCMSIAEHCIAMNDRERAVTFYDEALKFDPESEDAHVALSRLCVPHALLCLSPSLPLHFIVSPLLPRIVFFSCF